MNFSDFFKLYIEQQALPQATGVGTPQSEIESYAGEHSAPEPENGSPMFDLRLNGIYPKDFYQTISQYLYGETGENQMVSKLYACQGNQKGKTVVYRAVPKDVTTRINVGDWVTPVRAYATEHGRSNLNNDFKIITKTVRYRDLWNDGGSLLEWGYHPTDFNDDYDKQRRTDRYNKIIDKIQKGEKVFKINASPEDKWFGRENEYIADLYKRMPFLAQQNNEVQ